MRTVKISDAKNNLSRHIEYVKRGGRVRILDRDVPVADLVPIDPARGDEADEILDLERRGIARRGKAGPLPRDLLLPGPGRRAGVLRALLEERESSR